MRIRPRRRAARRPAPGTIRREPGRDGTLDKHGNPNVLTLDKGTSKLAQAPAAHSLLVEVECWNGPLPAVTAHAPPPIIVAAGDR